MVPEGAPVAGPLGMPVDLSTLTWLGPGGAEGPEGPEGPEGGRLVTVHSLYVGQAGVAEFQDKRSSRRLAGWPLVMRSRTSLR